MSSQRIAASMRTGRRALLKCMVAGLVGACVPTPRSGGSVIRTLLGPIGADQFSFALPHEHLLVDFIGAADTGPQRWICDDVVAALLPRLLEAKQLGIRGFVDCTPAYLGRDPCVLQRLAQQSGLHNLTNTGYYGDAEGLYLPASAHTDTAKQIAARWQNEWDRGIDESGVLPGFIKTRVDGLAGHPEQLSDMDGKLLAAAATVNRRTGTAVTCHSPGPSGLSAALRFVAEGGAPGKFVVAHCDGNEEQLNARIAATGAVVSLDSVGRLPIASHVAAVLPLLRHTPQNVLVSTDSGYYHAGEKNGGEILGFTALTDRFLPALRAAGVSNAQIHELTVANPARIFAV